MVSNNFMEIRMDWGGVFELGSLEGRGGSSSFSNSSGREGGGQETVPSVGGCGFFLKL